MLAQAASVSWGPLACRLLAHLGLRVRCANAPLSEAERTSTKFSPGYEYTPDLMRLGLIMRGD